MEIEELLGAEVWDTKMLIHRDISTYHRQRKWRWLWIKQEAPWVFYPVQKKEAAVSLEAVRLKANGCWNSLVSTEAINCMSCESSPETRIRRNCKVSLELKSYSSFKFSTEARRCMNFDGGPENKGSMNYEFSSKVKTRTKKKKKKKNARVVGLVLKQKKAAGYLRSFRRDWLQLP